MSLLGFKRSASRSSAISPSQSPFSPSAAPRLTCAYIIIRDSSAAPHGRLRSVSTTSLHTQNISQAHVKVGVLRIKQQGHAIFLLGLSILAASDEFRSPRHVLPHLGLPRLRRRINRRGFRHLGALERAN